MKNITFYRDERILSKLEKESIHRTALVKALKNIFHSDENILAIKFVFQALNSFENFNLNDEFLGDINYGRLLDHAYQDIYPDDQVKYQYQENIENGEILSHAGVDAVVQQSKILNAIIDTRHFSSNVILLELNGDFRYNLIVDSLGMFNQLGEVFYLLNPNQELINKINTFFNEYTQDNQQQNYFANFTDQFTQLILKNLNEDLFVIAYQFAFASSSDYYLDTKPVFYRPYEDMTDYISIIGSDEKIEHFIDTLSVNKFDIKNRIVFEKLVK